METISADEIRRRIARSATLAVEQAQAALDAGSLNEARPWVERAHRLAPDDPTATILFASIVVQSDPAAAAKALRALVERLPQHRPAHMALMAALLRAGQASDAAVCLDELLARTAPPDDDIFPILARSVCQAADRPGWMGLDGHGRCRVALTGSAPVGVVRLRLDGKSVGNLRVGQHAAACRPLPSGWETARLLEGEAGGTPLIGSGLSPFRFAVVEGFASSAPGGVLSGWARSVADPAARPSVVLRRDGADAAPLDLVLDPEADDGALSQGPVWRFSLPAPCPGRFGITDGRGRHLWGSPLLAGLEEEAARTAAHALAGHGPVTVDRFRPLPTGLLPVPHVTAATAKLPPCDVVVPIYDGRRDLEDCLASLRATLPRNSRLVLIDDGSPDPAIAPMLANLASKRITVLFHAQPRGFPGAVNAGLRHLGPSVTRDVMILNADTLVGPHWIERLSAVAHADPAIGSCTPLTNDGTLVSYPKPGTPGDAPSGDALAALNAACWAANGPSAVDLPTGVGFCMMMKGACLAEVGLFREDVFAQGYGEENDWCLRAAHLGWRNVAAPGVFVSHRGGRSFGAAKALLMERNAAVLERLHPGYERYVAAALAGDPLRPARRRIDRLTLLGAPGAPATALITHDAGGGVGRHVARRCAAIAEAGGRPNVLSPASEPGRCAVSLGPTLLTICRPSCRSWLPC